jgi:hypothetical protein
MPMSQLPSIAIFTPVLESLIWISISALGLSAIVGFFELFHNRGHGGAAGDYDLASDGAAANAGALSTLAMYLLS